MLDKTHFQFQYHVTIANRIFFLQKQDSFEATQKVLCEKLHLD